MQSSCIGCPFLAVPQGLADVGHIHCPPPSARRPPAFGAESFSSAWPRSSLFRWAQGPLHRAGDGEKLRMRVQRSSIFHTGIWDLPLIFVKKCAKSGIFYRSCPIEIPWGFWYTFVVIWCVPFATRPLWMFPHPQGAFFARFVTCAHSFLWFA